MHVKFSSTVWGNSSGTKCRRSLIVIYTCRFYFCTERAIMGSVRRGVSYTSMIGQDNEAYRRPRRADRKGGHVMTGESRRYHGPGESDDPRYEAVSNPTWSHNRLTDLPQMRRPHPFLPSFPVNRTVVYHVRILLRFTLTAFLRAGGMSILRCSG